MLTYSPTELVQLRTTSRSRAGLRPDRAVHRPVRRRPEPLARRRSVRLGRSGRLEHPLPLTVPDLDDDHPFRQIGNPRATLDEHALWTAQRELALEGNGNPQNRTFAWKSPQVSGDDANISTEST